MPSRREALTLLPGGWIPEAYKKCGFSNLSNTAAISLVKDAAIATALYQSGGKIPDLSAVSRLIEGTKPESKLDKYARELRAWTLVGGEKVVDLFPDTGKAAKILLGEEDPSAYLPLSRLPIQFDGKTDRQGAFEFINPKPNPKDTRKIVATLGGQRITADWLEYGSPAVVKMNPEVQASTVHLPILVKELSHMWIQPPLIEFYIRQMESKGVLAVRTSNPDNIPTSRNEELSMYLAFIFQIERSQYGYSSLAEFVDGAAAVEAAPLFATWRLDQQLKGIPIPNIQVVSLIQQYADYVEKKGLLDRGVNKVVWKEGLKPQLGTIDYARFMVGFLRDLDPNKKRFLLPID